MSHLVRLFKDQSNFTVLEYSVLSFSLTLAVFAAIACHLISMYQLS